MWMLTRQYRREVIVVFASLMFEPVFVYLSAFHAPRPHDIPFRPVEPNPSVAEMRDGPSSASPGGFDFRPHAGTRTAVRHGTINWVGDEGH
jgi:hypothetical protein